MKKSTKLTPIPFKENDNFLTINGTECFAIIFENEHTHRYVGYKLIESDIDFCMHFLEEKVKHPHSFSLHLSLAITSLYGKIFAKADGRGVKFQRSDIPREFHSIHDRVINYRNNFVAHAGGTYELGITVLGLNPNKNNKKILCVLPPHTVQRDSINPPLTDDLKKILIFLKEESQSRQKRIYELISKSVSDININELYKSFENVTGSHPEPIMEPGEYSTHFNIEQNSKMSFKLERKVST